jgi:hypothetical protein
MKLWKWTQAAEEPAPKVRLATNVANAKAMRMHLREVASHATAAADTADRFIVACEEDPVAALRAMVALRAAVETFSQTMKRGWQVRS